MGILRVYLALAVVLGHSEPILGFFGLPAHIAVRAFFMISGFYMALILGGKYQDDSLAFYKGRAMRLYPLYWMAVFLALIAGKLEWFSPNSWQSIPIWQAVLLRIPNLTIVGAEIPFLIHLDPQEGWYWSFGLASVGKPGAERASVSMIALGPAWSLGLEFWFYLMAPLLARCRCMVLLTIMLTSLLLLLVMEYNQPWSGYFFFPANLCFFCAGMLSYQLGRAHEELLISLSPRQLYSLGVVVAALLLFRQYVPHYRNHEFYVYTILVFGLPILFTCTKASEGDRILGNLSYPLYLIHLPVLTVLSATPLAGKGLGSVFVCFAIASLVVLLVDAPLERRRQRLISQSLHRTQSERPVRGHNPAPKSQ